MLIPRRVPFWRPLVALVGVLAVLWMALEGSVGHDMALAAAALALVVPGGIARWFGGRSLSIQQTVALGAGAGLVFGAGVSLGTLFLMALKTGIHAHGPEYTAAEVAWVWQQAPLWAGAGALAGAGLALVVAGRARR